MATDTTDIEPSMELFMRADDPICSFPIRQKLLVYFNSLIDVDYVAWINAVDRLIKASSKYTNSPEVPDKNMAGLFIFIHAVLKNGREWVSKHDGVDCTPNFNPLLIGLLHFGKHFQIRKISAIPLFKLISTLIKWSDHLDDELDKVHMKDVEALLSTLCTGIQPSNSYHVYGKWMNLCLTYFYVASDNELLISSSFVRLLESQLLDFADVYYPIESQGCTFADEETPSYNILKFIELNFCLVKFASSSPMPLFRKLVESDKFERFVYSQDNVDLVRICSFLTECGEQICNKFTSMYVFMSFLDHAVYDVNDFVDLLIAKEVSYLRGFGYGFLGLFLHWLKKIPENTASNCHMHHRHFQLLRTFHDHLENMARVDAFPYDIRPLCRRIKTVLDHDAK